MFVSDRLLGPKPGHLDNNVFERRKSPASDRNTSSCGDAKTKHERMKQKCNEIPKRCTQKMHGCETLSDPSPPEIKHDQRATTLRKPATLNEMSEN